MTTDHYFGVSLRVFHDTSTPAEISTALQREARVVGVKGTSRGRGRAVPTTAIWREHYWCSDFDEGNSPEERIETVVCFLASREAELKSLLRSGGRADIYACLAPNVAHAIELKPGLLGILGGLGVTLGIDFVPAPPRA